MEEKKTREEQQWRCHVAISQEPGKEYQRHTETDREEEGRGDNTKEHWAMQPTTV